MLEIGPSSRIDEKVLEGSFISFGNFFFTRKLI